MLVENSIALKTGTAEQIKREIMERREAKQDDHYNGNGN